MKRYLLFTGNTWYPAAGWLGMRGAYDREKDAVKDGRFFTSDEYRPTRLTEPSQHDWWHVVDLNTGRIVIEGEKGEVKEPEGLPDYLKYDAPQAQCSGCGRLTDASYAGMECRMSQPFGNVCGGTFEAPATL